MTDNKKDKTPVWIVDDNINFCVILEELINRSKAFYCDKYYHSIKAVIRGLRELDLRPKIMLLDIKMPLITGLDGLISIKRIDPTIQVVMLTSYDDETDIRTALQNGASGYLSKSTGHIDIIRSLERLMEGGKVIDPIIAEKMIESVIGSPWKSDYRLTHREKEIIKLLTEGNNISEISQILGISFYTAETHRKNIFQKLDVHTTHGLVAKAVKESLID